MKLVLLLAACVCAAQASFVFRRCGGNNDVEVSSVLVEPAVISVPGKIKVSFDGKITKGFNNVDLKLDIYRKMFFGDVRLPCLFNLGSCTYSDLCTILDRMERENWASIGAKLASIIKSVISDIPDARANACPFKPAVANVKGHEVELPPAPPGLVMLASGKYKARAEIRNRDTKELMSCFELELEIRKAD